MEENNGNGWFQLEAKAPPKKHNAPKKYKYIQEIADERAS